VLWLKELGLLFGVTAYAAATTLAVFFLGLAAGSFAWGQRSARLANPLRTYGWLEVGIALSAGLYFWILDVYQWVYPKLFGLFGHQPALLLGVKLVLALGILLPPAFFMGGTLPVMGQYLVRDADRFGRTTTMLYAVNTLGAAAGALLAGFYLPAVLGFRTSYLMAMALNLAIAAVTLWWSRAETPSAATASRGKLEAATGGTERSGMGSWLIWTIAVASGLLTLALEVLWTRMFAQVLQNSVYTFAAILTVFLVALGLGSLVAHLLCRAPWPPAMTLFALLVVAGLLVASTPPVFYWQTDGLQLFGADLGWTSYVVAVFKGVAAVILLPALVAGTIFPYLMKLIESAVISAGSTIGRLVSVNTVAAILGSMLAGFVLLDWLGLWRSIQLLSVAYLFLSLAALLAVGGVRRLAAMLPVAAIVAISLAPQYGAYGAVSLDTEAGEELAELWEGAHGTVAVIRAADDLRLKVNNHYSLGSARSTINQRVQAWLAVALHPKPKSAFFLGMGTGITAGGALDFPIERLVVTELNPDVVEASRLHFGPYLNGLFEDPRVEIVVDDGRAVLAGTVEGFDLVVGDIFLTYRAGVGSLYSREHLETVRARLKPGGIFVQWLPMFELSEEEFGIIARTMLDVFPQVSLWRRSVSPRFPVYALVASAGGAPLDSVSFRGNLLRLVENEVVSPEVWFANIPLSAFVGNLSAVADAFAGYPVSTDDKSPLEYLAPITERQTKGAKVTETLSWHALAELAERLLSGSNYRADPFLAKLGERELDEIEAGLAYYQFETYRRLGDEPTAATHRRRYEELVGTSKGGER